MSNIAFLFLPLAFSSLPAVLPFVSPSSQVGKEPGDSDASTGLTSKTCSGEKARENRTSCQEEIFQPLNKMVNQYKQNVTADKERIGGLVGLRRPSHRPVRSPFEWERRVDHAQEAKECSGHFPVLVQVSQVQVDHDRSQLDFVGQELVFEFPARGSAATHREPLSGINNSPNDTNLCLTTRS